MTMISRPRAARLTAAASLPLMLLISTPAFAAHPAPDTGAVAGHMLTGGDVGRADVFITPRPGSATAAKLIPFTAEGDQKITVFCVDQLTPIPDDRAKVAYTSAPRSSVKNADAAKMAKAAAIAVNGQKIGTKLESPAQEAAAEQIAIWVLTNGEKLDNVVDPVKRARAKELLDKATALPEGPSSVVLTLQVAPVVDPATKASSTATVVAHVEDAAKKPLANQTVKFTAAGATLTAVTNAEGDATQTLELGEATLDVLASVDTVIPGGTVFTGPGSQPVITTADLVAHREATASLPAAVKPKAAPAPAPSKVAEPAPAKPKATPAAPVAKPAPQPVEELPFTGTEFQPWMIALLAGIAAAAAFVVTRVRS